MIISRDQRNHCCIGWCPQWSLCAGGVWYTVYQHIWFHLPHSFVWLHICEIKCLDVFLLWLSAAGHLKSLQGLGFRGLNPTVKKVWPRYKNPRGQQGNSLTPTACSYFIANLTFLEGVVIFVSCRVYKTKVCPTNAELAESEKKVVCIPKQISLQEPCIVVSSVHAKSKIHH